MSGVPRMRFSKRKAKGDAMTPVARNSPAIAATDSPGCTVTMTSLPLPAKIGSICKVNQPATNTMSTITPSSTRPIGLVSMVAIKVVLQHDDSGCRQDVEDVLLGL